MAEIKLNALSNIKNIKSVSKSFNLTGEELASLELKKLEYCGDKMTQIHLGEECDDGNEIAGDGCDKSCLKELSCQFDNECVSGYCGFNNICEPLVLEAKE